jgi:acid phosphatase (class A)
MRDNLRFDHGCRRTWLILPLAALLLAAGCRDHRPSAVGRVPTSAAAAAKAPGYLKPEERPDAIALLPPPPAPGSREADADATKYRELKPLEGTARWALAHADSNLKFPEAPNAFACALGIRIDPKTTPRLYTLLHRSIIDAGQSTYPAKLKYNRTRPFVDTGDPTCVPEDEEVLHGNGSYPSGHASLGYVWAEVLAEVAPDRAAALRERGYQFGKSRAVCRVHYQSDVDAGRAVGAAVMPILRANAEYRADVEAAKIEARKARVLGPDPGSACDAEAAALRPTATQPGVTP